MPSSRKAEARLSLRTAAWDAHGKSPRQGDNPSNGRGNSHDMHRPGSQKK